MAIPIQDLPRLSRLTKDYLTGTRRAEEYFGGDFRDPAAFKLQAQRVKSRSLPRQALVSVLRQQNQAYGCGPRTLEHIENLGREETCAIVTGQQAGLFAGPLYTIYKALTAIRLAEHLNRTLGENFVPVFWSASDDHDRAEIDHIRLLDRSNEIQILRYPTPTPRRNLPASDIILTREIDACLEQLDEYTQESEFKAEILAPLREAYKPGRSFSESFAVWMTHLFKSYGLIFIDPSHPELKALGRAVFLHEVAGRSPSTQKALETSHGLSADNYSQQVRLREGILNLFLADPERRAILFDGDAFRIKGTKTTYSRDELMALIDRNPQLFSPNVLLRPILQDALLPTVAYIAGPGEIAYFAQTKGIYGSFGLPMPIIYPRKSATIVERKIDRLLKAYDLTVRDVWHVSSDLIAEITARHIPRSLDEVLSETAGRFSADLEALKQEVTAFDPALERTVDITVGKIDQHFKILGKKIQQAAKKQNAIVTQQLHKILNGLYPHKHLQERRLNIVPFLIKYGPAFLDTLYRGLDSEGFDHEIITL